MNNAPNVKCPVHGEHGALKDGGCWYCAVSGMSAPSQTPVCQTTNRVVLAYKGEK